MFYDAEDSKNPDKHLIVKIHALSNYTPQAPGQNGFNGRYGTINLKGGTHVDLKLQIFDKEGNPAHLELVYFTFFDLDTGHNGATTEFVKARPYNKAIFLKNTELKEKRLGEGNSMFTATKFGTGADNPSDPSSLTDEQKNRAVTFEFA